jgi:anti-sigma factor RsiW
MNCAEIEILICDYVDGTLTTAQKAQVNLHLAVCPACTELARDSAAAVRFIAKAEDVTPPAELVTGFCSKPRGGRTNPR